nr:heme-binding protein [Spirosomataceae bacterium]
MKKKLLIPLSILGLVSCLKPVSTTIVSVDTETGTKQAKQVKESSTIQLAEGLTIDLWATDSLAPDPVAMSIDDAGRIYITRTNRQKNSEFDIRGHRDWMTPSIALQSVEDRRAFLRDVSTKVYEGPNEEVTDVIGGILVRQKDAFVTTGPDMLRLKDKNNDGFYESSESINHGYAVHIGFSGHGMSGATEGPDGKIYWQIGDIGANITDKSGKKHEYPNEGILVRSNPDGSDFEVVTKGIRNTHEFVFDEYGNIISSDNDGDHPGESERLVHLVEGGD